MRTTLNKLSITNFKYIKPTEVKVIDFFDNDIVILDGPNGYGKTTIFDSIELLITGQIRHFHTKLQNRGSISLSELVNDQSQDLVIKGEFIDGEGNVFIICRTCSPFSNFSQRIHSEESGFVKELTQEELCKKIGINPNIFHITTYISQSQSLSFLEQKYSDRKDQLTGVLDDPDSTAKIEKIKALKQNFSYNLEVEEEKWLAEEIKLQSEVNSLNVQMHNLNDLRKSSEYHRLFAESEYGFDKKNVDITVEFEVYSKELSRLESLIKNFVSFQNAQYNSKIKDAINKEKMAYMSYYFRDLIEYVRKNENQVGFLQQTKKYIESISSRKFSVNKEVLKKVNLEDTVIESAKFLEQSIFEAEKLLSGNQVLINRLNDERKHTIELSKKIVEEGILKENECPLCGRKSEELMSLFDQTTNQLTYTSSNILKKINEEKSLLEKLFETKILPALKDYLQQYAELLHNSILLKDNLGIETKKVEEKLLEFGVLEFKCKDGIVKLDSFEADYEKIIQLLKEKIKNVELIISDYEMQEYSLTWNQFYKKEKPNHTVADIEAKRSYLVEQFANNFNLQLQEKLKNLKVRQEEMKTKFSQLKEIEKNIGLLLNVYVASDKEYKSRIANRIKVPLFLYTGRIIQNYPLGLGINVDVKENQVVFKVADKETDAFNFLSTGQLNGLMISIMLSVRSAFSKEIGFENILIDDPLQSIDDISAISFADLMAEEFKESNLLISTHEDDKENMLFYKFNQVGKKVASISMQEEYLKSK